MNTFNITEIAEDSLFTDELFLDEQFLLLPASVPFTSKMRQALLEWEFRQVVSEGGIGEKKKPFALDPEKAAAARALLGNTVEDVSDEFQDNSDDKNVSEEEDESLDIAEGSVMQKALSLVEKSGTANASIEKNQLNLVQTVYNEYTKYILEIYTYYATHKKLDYEKISENVKELCVFINEHRRYILRAQSPYQSMEKMYLINHAIRSTIIAITIGIQLKMPLAKQVELGVACILHEIGMLKLPPQVYLANKPLTQQEKNSVYTHPLFSYNILKECEFPLSICLGALEHHEKENGMGYPRRLSGAKISVYAKIIAVACSYEAISSPRAYKTTTGSSFDAMIELLKNPGHQYDENIIKALLFAVSLYPIGAFVFLHNGQIGQVVDVNPDNPKQPIVQIIGKKDEHGEPVTEQTGPNLKIIRTLTRQEYADLQKTLKH